MTLGIRLAGSTGKGSITMSRANWFHQTDAQLLADCEVDTYRASGPGGQKRNKTSSAVRIRHAPSGLLVIAEESRSQHENKAKALVRLRQAFMLKLREPISAEELSSFSQREELASSRSSAGRIELSRKSPKFWEVAGLILDLLEAHLGRVSDAAKSANLSTGHLIDFLETDPKVWEQANQIRQRFGQKPLKMSD